MDRVGSPDFSQQLQTVQLQFSTISAYLGRSLQAGLHPVVNGSRIQQLLRTVLGLGQRLEKKQNEFDVSQLVVVGDLLQLKGEDLSNVETRKLKDKSYNMLVQFGMTGQSQMSGFKTSRLLHEPIIGKRQQISVCQLVCNSAKNSASPLSNLFAFRKKRWFEYLQKEEAHIVLLGHPLHNEVHLHEPPLHKFLDLLKLPLDSLHQNMR